MGYNDADEAARRRRRQEQDDEDARRRQRANDDTWNIINTSIMLSAITSFDASC